MKKCEIYNLPAFWFQIYVPHPDYPATRLSVRLPSLGFHLSPARYHRLLQILKVFQDSTSDEQGNLFRPWDPADFEGEVSVLVFYRLY